LKSNVAHSNYSRWVRVRYKCDIILNLQLSFAGTVYCFGTGHIMINPGKIG